MAKFRLIPESETVNQLQFMCPGCNQIHALNTTWTFNNNFDKPSVMPSVLVSDGVGGKLLCHSFITDGNIQFLDDCTHKLKGKTVELPDIDV